MFKIFQKLFSKKNNESELKNTLEPHIIHNAEKIKEIEAIKLYLNNMQSNFNGNLQVFNQDIDNLKQWITYLYNKKLEHKDHISNIKRDLDNSVNINDFHNIKEQLNLLHYKASKLEENQSKLISKYDELLLKTSVSQALKEEPTYKTNLQNTIAKQVNKNSKSFIKRTIKNLIKKHQIIKTSVLREIIVEDMKICSQSTLYRILNEIRSEPDIKTHKSEKEFVYQIA